MTLVAVGGGLGGPRRRPAKVRSPVGLAATVALAVGCSSSSPGAPARDGGSPADARSRPLDAPVVDARGAADAPGEAAPPPGSDATPVPPGRGQPRWLHANGGALVNTHGQTVRLLGVNRSGTEYACVNGSGIFDGPSDAASIAAIKSWKVNAVRVPLNEDCWLGINGAPAAYSGAAYRSAIVAYVELLLTSGIYPIVDLHWTAPGGTLATGQEPMPDADHAVDFWTSVATTFKGDPDVILELFNEPWPDSDQDTDAAWSCWQSGGTCPGVSFPAVGMQALVTAVRATGAGNFLLLGGIVYSNSLSQWVARKPADPLDNLGAAWHSYATNACNDTTCWQQQVQPVLEGYPVVATEIGDSACEGTYPTSVMTWLDTQAQSYLGWTWDAYPGGCSDYALISDYSGTPTQPYGAAFQSHLAAVGP